MIKKILVTLIMTCLILTSANVTCFADSVTLYSTSKTISLTKGATKVTGFVPVIKNLSSPVFQSKLNALIETTYTKTITDASTNRVKNLKLNFDVVVDGDYLSIILYSTNATTSTSSIETFVINRATNTYSTINTILGSNGVNYANKVIENKIKNDKTTKYYSTPTISDDHSFYYKGGNVVVLFGAGTISPASRGVMSFEVFNTNLKNVVINPLNYYTKSDYNVKMIPLRSTVESLGYTLTFNASNSKITIVKGSSTATLTVGRNSYTKGKFSPKQLEFAPEIRNGYTYVPISFFGEILDLLFAVDGTTNNVTISQYTL